MKSSLIKSLNLENYRCISADKNISVGDEYKYILVHMEFRNKLQEGYKISTVFCENRGGKISLENNVKVLVAKQKGNTTVDRVRLVAYSVTQITEELLSAVEDVLHLFEDVDTPNKKLYS